ncbi:EamA family transporter [uncultured Campylobacter sp.]|uniref:EamA family transporter n=1 Tax=uncultured Campylobacter sp. TaxID=218934 RepID=UPI002627F90E|nr:EamA family transporter [uncultured Campylobacter sp.]
MKKLILVTCIWAFSFSLIGEFLRGIDSAYLAFLRVSLALICFLPFMKFRGVNPALAFKICAVGAVQIGVMYIFYYRSFAYLKVYEVALFTIFTPFYVTLLYDALKLRFRALYLFSVAVAVLGALVIKFGAINSEFLTGFLLVQGANLCFGLGQSVYKFMLERHGFSEQKELFGYFFVGATAVTAIAAIVLGDFSKFNPSFSQGAVIVYLGTVASALGYFLWNKGACEVDSGVLAIMNNALIPAAIAVNLVFWQKDADLARLLAGSALIYVSLILHKKIMKFYAVREQRI